MRILLVSQEFPPATAHGGIATQMHAKARGLAARGHDVTVLTTATNDHRAGAAGEPDGGIRLVRLLPPESRLPLRTPVARTIAWSTDVAAAIESLHADVPFEVVEFAEYGAEGFVFLANRAAARGPRVVVGVHGPTRLLSEVLGWPEPGSPEAALAIELEERCLALADDVFACSSWSADFVARTCGLPRERIAVLHTGVDVAHFAPRGDREGREGREGRDAGPPTVVFAGKIARSKGVDVLGAAALRLAPRLPGLRVRLVGRAHEPTLVATLHRQAVDAGHPDLFDVRGGVTHDRLPEELTAADVFAAPSPCEGGPGFAWLEAMACGLPAIACAGTGVEATVRGGALGALVAPGDVDALANALHDLLADRERCAAIGRRAREHVLATASREPCLDRIEAWLCDVVQSGGDGRQHRTAAR